MNPGSDLLSQLRDIHSVPVSWWPPAPGWWVLTGLLIIVLYMLLRKFLARLEVQRRRRQLLGFIDQLTQDVDPAKSPQEYLSGLNRVFKLVAIRAFPEKACAQMQGHQWTGFLKENLGQEHWHDSLEMMADGVYRPFASFDATELVMACRKWVEKYG